MGSKGGDRKNSRERQSRQHSDVQRKRSAPSTRQRDYYYEDEAPVRRRSSQAKKGNTKQMSPKQLAKKRRIKILAFIAEFFILLLLIIAYWGISKVQDIQYVEIPEEDIEIATEVQQAEETGAMKGYMNVALFGVDSINGELNKNTRTDTMIIASINMDTKEVKLVSLYRDSYMNQGNDLYGKANGAYAKGGAKQALSMMNMNLDMNIKYFVTSGFAALTDVIDAVGGIEIDVKEEEISHLNNYQICIAGRPDGTLNAAGEPNYEAIPYEEYIPVEHAGLQTLNGLQATAYCRIRYVGNDFARTSRQRTVLQKVAQKAVTLNPATLNKIAEAVFPKVATNFKLSEIVSLMGGVADYKVVDNTAFPFEGMYKTGRVGSKGSCIVPITLEDNVVQLHKYLFDEEWTVTETAKKCSDKVYSDTSQYMSY